MTTQSIAHAENNDPAFQEQINLVHTALFGWPCDQLTPVDAYRACTTIHEVALEMLDSERFRWDIRDKVGLWPRDKWVMTPYKGFDVWVNLFDSFVSFGVLHENWEEEETAFMVRCLKPGDGMIDVGANIGVYAIQAASVVGPFGKIHAFEPNKKTFEMLDRTMRANGFSERCVLHNAGLGASDTTGSFHLSSHATNPGSSYISVRSGGEQVDIHRMDSIEYERPIRFIKIDVEGYEYHVIEGAKATLAAHSPTILTEFFPRSLKEIGQVCGTRYIELLESLGYRMTVFSTTGDRASVTPSNASQYEEITTPINLVCTRQRATPV